MMGKLADSYSEMGTFYGQILFCLQLRVSNSVKLTVEGSIVNVATKFLWTIAQNDLSKDKISCYKLQ